MNNSLLLFVSGLVAFWTIVYALGKGKKEKVEVYPGALLIRAGIKLEPMGEGVSRKLLVVFGYLSTLLLMVSAAFFYYYVAYLIILKYWVKPTGGVTGFAPLIPGVTLSWTDTLYVFLAIGIAAFFHELGHAYVSRAVGVKVKDAGIAFFLFIPAAFVEPDEDELKKARLKNRVLIYSAGVGANVILALLSLFLLAQASGLAQGVQIADVEPDSPAMLAGLKPGDIILDVNGHPVKTLNDLINAFEEAGVKNASKDVTLNLTVSRGGEIITLTVHKPAGASKIGIILKQLYKYNWLIVFLKANYILNLSLALVNAAPLALPLPGGVVMSDGGQILRDVLAPLVGEEKAAMLSVFIGTATLIAIISLMSLTRLQIS